MYTFAAAVAALMVLSAGGASATEQAFDLVCKGPVTMFLPETTSYPTPHDTTIRLHLDVVGMNWCEDKCKYIKPIASLTDGLIVLGETPYPVLGVMTQRIGNETINRLTGIYSMNFMLGKIMISGELSCTKAPFTAMPSAKF